MTTKIPVELHPEIIEMAEKEYKKGFTTQAISLKAVDYLKTKEIDVSPRTIRRFLESRDKKVAQAINTIVNTTYDIDIERPKQMIDTIVSFLDTEIKKSFSKPDLGTNTLQRQKEIISWLNCFSTYIDLEIKIATLTSSSRSESNSNMLEQAKIVMVEEND